MAAELLGQDSCAGDGYMDLLKDLSREEILEVLSEGFCKHCEVGLRTRAQNLITRKYSEVSVSNGDNESSADLTGSGLDLSVKSVESHNKNTSWSSQRTPESVYFGRQKGYVSSSSPASVNDKRPSSNHNGTNILLNDGLSRVPPAVDDGLSEEQKENIRFAQVVRKKEFVHIDRIDGKPTNVVQGLELHTRVFNVEEQKKIVECVHNLQRMGQKGQLRERTYSEPRKWMRGKGRVTIQFGCCYNYAVDKNGNPPGILREEEVDPLPPLFKQMIKRMVRWHVLPPSCVPNSCIVNIYDEGDCIPPHIDHHDFLRPFCTVSFLTECNILFGSNLKIVKPGEFSGPVSIPLPVGSVLVLKGNGADIAKHCVPAVPAKRISITFRKMDESKLPYTYLPEAELLGIKPLIYSPLTKSPAQQNQLENGKDIHKESPIVAEKSSKSFEIDRDDFPPLGSSTSMNQKRSSRNGLKH